MNLMEILLSVAIIIILGSLLAVSSNTAFQGASQSAKAVNTAVTINRIDRQIRTRANAVHIPYWADAAPYTDAVTSELLRSRIGTYIKSVRIISDRRRNPHGIEVVYTVNNREMKTTASFSSISIMDRNR